MMCPHIDENGIAFAKEYLFDAFHKCFNAVRFGG